MNHPQANGRPMTVQEQYQDGWVRATQLAAALRQGAAMPAQGTAMVLEQGETYHCGVSASVAAYHGADVSYDSSFFAMGSTWKGMAATAGASMLYSGHQKRKAERQAAVQWRSYGVCPLHVTSYRLLIVSEGQWHSHWYEGGIIAYEPDFPGYRAVIHVNGGNPVMFEGPAVPYLAVLLHVYLRREIPDFAPPPTRPDLPPPPAQHSQLPPPPRQALPPPPAGA